MIYLCAGLYAEGPSDYAFLQPFLDRLLEDIAASLYPASYEVAPTVGIDAFAHGLNRESRIAAAIAENYERCNLFVIHSDGASDHELAQRQKIDPGIEAARSALPGDQLVAVPCVPVREIEAWLLADADAFRPLLTAATLVTLPANPERETDPKAALDEVLAAGGFRGKSGAAHGLLGERVRVSALRRLRAFKRFDSALHTAIQSIAGFQGHRS